MARMKWFRGNIHTHTTKSDGDADPKTVVRWYRKHGYDFLVLSDHNHLTVLEYGAREREFKRPLMIPGEEVSSRIKGGQVPIHVNGIGMTRVVEPVDTGDIVSTIQANVDAIVQAGGLASINHPNYQWAFNHEHISKVVGATMMEIYNAIPVTNSNGAPGRPGTEEIWDRVLSAGRVIWGAASDDSHNYHDFTPELSNPGRGWLMVRASTLSQPAIVDAIAAGDFYASSGVLLEEFEVSKNEITLAVQQSRDAEYKVEFIGRGGAVLSEQEGLLASYRIQGDEGYVRARLTSSGGLRAWTQPVVLGRRS